MFFPLFVLIKKLFSVSCWITYLLSPYMHALDDASLANKIN